MSEVSDAQVVALNVIARNPEAMLLRAGLDKSAEAAMARAARFQVALDVLDEIATEGFDFRMAEVEIKDKS